MEFRKDGFCLIEVLVAVIIFSLFLFITNSFVGIYVHNYLNIFKEISSINEIGHALNTIENNIFIAESLLNEDKYSCDESNLSLGYTEEGIYKKVSYSLYKKKIRKKMNNTAYLTTKESNILSLKFYYNNQLISFKLKIKYGALESNIDGKAALPIKI